MFEYHNNGTIKNCAKNIEIMRDYFDGLSKDAERGYLEDHQLKFVNNLLDYYNKHGRLSDKQFNWLMVYYGEAADESDDWHYYDTEEHSYRFA